MNGFFSAIERDIAAADLAARLKSAFPGSRPSDLVGRLGLCVESGSWFPVTAGEYSSATGVITVNQSAAVDSEVVIAHELGHHFLHQLGRKQDEGFCDEFAEALTRCDRN